MRAMYGIFMTISASRPAASPIGVVLTIAATGSEMSDSSVITKEDGWIKRGYSNDLSRPRFAVMNPDLTKTLPDYQTACGCTDILMHTMERYFTNGGNMEITDSMAEALMRTVIKNAKILAEDPLNYDARAEILWAGSLSHNGLTGCGNAGGDFASHALEHEIGGLFDVAHGAGLAAIWGSWARYVYQNCLPRFHRFAVNVMGIEDLGAPDDTALRHLRNGGLLSRHPYAHLLAGAGNRAHGRGLKDNGPQMTRWRPAGRKDSAMVLHEDDMLAIYRMADHGPEKAAAH